MRTGTSDLEERTSPAWRTVVIGLCCAGAVGGLGCATMELSTRTNPNADAHYNKPVLTDSIFALGLPDAALAKKIGHQDAVAFIGKQHSYLLIEGGKPLSGLARAELDGAKLIMESAPRQLFRKDKAIWGTVSFRYAPGQDATQTESDVAKLRTLGFTADGKGVYRLSIPVKGMICPPAKLSKDLPEAFKSRDIAFYNPPESSPPPDLGKLVGMPFAIVADAALISVGTGVVVTAGVVALPIMAVIGIAEAVTK